MAKMIGRFDNLGIGLESVRGTAVTADIWMPWTDLEFDDEIKTAVDEASMGVLETSDGEDITSTNGAVTIKSKVKDISFGYLLLSLLGTDTPAAKSGGNSAVYDHVFTVLQTTQHPTLSLALKGPNDDVVMANSLVDSLKITAEVNKYIMFEAKATGKASISASNTAAYTPENDFHSKHVSFKLATNQAGLDAASAVAIRKFELEIKGNVTLDESLGATPVVDVLNGGFEISGSVTVTYNATTYHDLMMAGSYRALRFQMLNSDVTIGASANPTLKIDLHRCKLQSVARKRGPNDIVEETFSFKAHRSVTDGAAITATLTNLLAAY